MGVSKFVFPTKIEGKCDYFLSLFTRIMGCSSEIHNVLFLLYLGLVSGMYLHSSVDVNDEV